MAPVVTIEDSEDLRFLTVSLLKRRLGVDCLAYASLADMQEHTAEVLQTSAAVIDVNLGPGQPDGLDVLHWLQSHGYRGEVFFLTGHARSNPHVVRACGTGIRILEKPVQPDQFCRLVGGALGQAPA